MQYTSFQAREAVWSRVQIALSLAVTLYAFWAAYQLKVRLPGELGGLQPFGEYAELLVVVGVAWYVFFDRSGLYRAFLEKTTLSIVASIARIVGAGALVLVGYVWLLRRLDIASRLLFAIFAVLDFLLLVSWHLVLFHASKRWSIGGFHRRRVLVVGEGDEAREMIRALDRMGRRRIEVIGVLGSGEAPGGPGPAVEGKPVLGVLADLEQVIGRHVVDEVIFALDSIDPTSIRDHLMTCELRGVQARIKSNVFGSLIAKTRIDELAGYQLLSFSTTPQAHWQLFFKELLDRVGALALLVLFSPVLAVVAILVRLTSVGPALFSQTRCGLNGRRFIFYKFRTMIAGAQEMRHELEEWNEMDGPVFKIRGDPRITPLGAFLRRHSLDELPQLWNVLRGEMSFVGPRPPLPDEVEKYEPWQRRRLSMKPGLTCIWQVSGRNQIPFHRWMELDLEYIDRWSLKLDFLIFLKTIPALLTGRGAS
ncbi:MAG: sugar transferase [Planctomycetes bacterium]|nr:sugar transferase [Planctomycetota bacterium]